jgi:sulfotransferase
VVDYDLLTQAPEKVMKLVYDFIGEPQFAHDFEHGIRRARLLICSSVCRACTASNKVAFTERRTVIPPDFV